MINVVWFKRDLRIHDNEALTSAAKDGPLLPLYIYEPSLWEQEEMSFTKQAFLRVSLEELNLALKELGQGLIIKKGNAVDILDNLNKRHGIRGLYSHQETWNGWTYKRDLEVRRWLKSKGIRWHEARQNGVIRSLGDRNGWAKNWQSQMTLPLFKAPQTLDKVGEKTDKIDLSNNKLEHNLETQMLAKGGRKEGLSFLHSFLNIRGENYTKQMSSPLTAVDSCSLLSSHLAYGTVSIRETFQAAQSRKREIQSFKKYW